MKKFSREIRLIVPSFLLLFLGVGVLSVSLLAGESRRTRILVEYEADRIASSLSDTFRVEGSLEQAALDPRIRGFGLYAPGGNAAVRIGDAPPALDPGGARNGFRYDRGRGLLTLERLLGVGGPGMMGPEAGRGLPLQMGRGMMGSIPGGGMMGGPGLTGPGRPRPGISGRSGDPHGPAGALFLSMDISAYYRSRMLYRAATFVSPFVIAGLAALFLSLLASNLRHRRRAQEQDTLARLGESARTLAHEIRNPLGAIRIQTGLLRRKLPGEASAQLDAIEEEVQRLSLLSRRVSDYLSNPRGDPKGILLDAFLRELVARQPRPASYSASREAQGVTVTMDAELLRSAMENLVRNAHESYPDGEGDVEVALTRERGSAVIAVRDRGRGIPPELSEKVFDPFFTDKVHGSGVGLSLSRRFVEAAGGTLALLHRSGGGTEARIALPAGGPR
jgi:signal transduction histidine kinase